MPYWPRFTSAKKSAGTIGEVGPTPPSALTHHLRPHSLRFPGISRAPSFVWLSLASCLPRIFPVYYAAAFFPKVMTRALEENKKGKWSPSGGEER